MTTREQEETRLSLRVTGAHEIAAGIHRIELRAPDGGELPPFTPGAHLTVDTPAGCRRTYSLCNDPAERDRYVLAVKREEPGRGGSLSMARAKEGDALRVSTPRNTFALSAKARRSILIAGGIGITPILSMVWHLRAVGAPFELVYCTRNPSSTAFLSELQDPELRPHVVIHHDDGDPLAAYDFWPLLESPRGAHVYCCGPRGLNESVRDMTGHWPAEAVHFESFGVGADPTRVDTAFDVVLARSGLQVRVGESTSILDAVRRAGVQVPSSCESGTCGSCRTRLLAGEADHRDMVLLDEEKQDNIMVCVSRSCGGELVLDL